MLVFGSFLKLVLAIVITFAAAFRPFNRRVPSFTLQKTNLSSEAQRINTVIDLTSPKVIFKIPLLSLILIYDIGHYYSGRI